MKKAPDKIYIGLEDVGSGYTWNISILDNGTEQYIRKNALLEWIDGKMTIEDETEGYIGGYDAALKEVIDKISSL